MTSGDRGTDNETGHRISWREAPRRPAVLMASGVLSQGTPLPRRGRPHELGFPRTREEFDEWFPDDDACAVYLARLRWPSGFLCPNCGPVDPWLKSRGRLVCPNCRYETTVTAGTLFAGSRKPLRKWFEAAWYFAESQGTMPISVLQRILGLRSYKTAWLWAHKLRDAMIRGGLERLRGRVAISVLRVEAGSPGQAAAASPFSVLLAVALELRGVGTGRVRMAGLRDTAETTLCRFIKETVEEESLLEPDPESLASFPGVPAHQYPGRKTTGAASPRGQVRRLIALMEQWLASASRGPGFANDPDPYLDEFTIYLNWRGARHHGQLFQRLLQSVVRGSSAYYRGHATVDQ